MTNHCSGEITFRNSFQGPNIFIYLLLFFYSISQAPLFAKMKYVLPLSQTLFKRKI